MGPRRKQEFGIRAATVGVYPCAASHHRQRQRQLIGLGFFFIQQAVVGAVQVLGSAAHQAGGMFTSNRRTSVLDITGVRAILRDATVRYHFVDLQKLMRL